MKKVVTQFTLAVCSVVLLSVNVWADSKDFGGTIDDYFDVYSGFLLPANKNTDCPGCYIIDYHWNFHCSHPILTPSNKDGHRFECDFNPEGCEELEEELVGPLTDTFRAAGEAACEEARDNCLKGGGSEAWCNFKYTTCIQMLDGYTCEFSCNAQSIPICDENGVRTY